MLNHQRIAIELFAHALRKLGLTVTEEGLQNSGLKVTFSSEEEGKHAGEVEISTRAVRVVARVWLTEVQGVVIGNLRVTEYLNHAEHRTRPPVNAWTRGHFNPHDYVLGQDVN